uniref:Putative endonuclease/reverse transcript n=1 Tax=Ixodes ricinus TaxID=34613 RepID=V5GF41_IXORI
MVLGPLFSLLIINDIPFNLAVKARLFADNCILYTEIKTPTGQLNPSTCLAHIGQWKMSLNFEKTVHTTITHKTKPTEFTYSLEGHPIARASSYKYLGITISHDLRWETRTNSTVKRVHSKLQYLKGH